ncbi:pirin family protein [Neisseriaceae bacterium CLB008]|nr:pirin family protein [Neisseriaceae bacterium]
MKQINAVYSAPQGHWVGDGFPVRSLFSYQTLGRQLSPFLLLDYAGPAEFTPTTQARGVGTHPHRGFETVTIVYQGAVAHEDSTGEGGEIGPGDVQWMTAGAGILHKEHHAQSFAQSGGTLQMVQLWVNLPAAHKMTPPRYQAIVSHDIPTVTLADKASTLRVIAGEFEGHQGPAQTFSPLNVWDMRLKAGQVHDFALTEGDSAALIVLEGSVLLNGHTLVRNADLALLSQDGQRFNLEATTDSLVLLLSGTPIDEPIAGYGPFVMNTEEEIQQAFSDMKSGRFGQLI